MGDLGPARGHEQSGKRPLLVISDDLFNTGSSSLVVVVPFTTRSRGVATQLEVTPPEGGLRRLSHAKCEDIRAVSKERLTLRMGQVTHDTMEEVRYRLRRILAL
jgi:mRNA interferase MazF